MVFEVQDSRFLDQIAAALPEFLKRQRWFGGKAKPIRACHVVNVVPIRTGAEALSLFLVRVEFAWGNPQTYALPLQQIATEREREAAKEFSLRVQAGGESVTLADAPSLRDFPNLLIDLIGQGERFRGISGELVGIPSSAFQSLRGSGQLPDASILGLEQSNTSIVYGNRLILKLFRLVEEGVNPEIEICSFLTDRTSFKNFATVAGSLEYQEPDLSPTSLGVLQAFVSNQGDSWKFTLGALKEYFDRVSGSAPADSAQLQPLLARSDRALPVDVEQGIGSYLQSAQLLGRRTAELHVALASEPRDPDFVPVAFTPEYQKSIHSSMMGLIEQNLDLLRDRNADLDALDQELASQVLDREGELRAGLGKILDRRMSGLRTRVHGDYHLGQVLYTGSDFVIIDFEGEPARPLHERRTKHSPLKDVAGMLRSFHYAVYSALFERTQNGQPDHSRDLDSWARYWRAHVSAVFLRSYLTAAAQGRFLPETREELKVLLDVNLLEKAVYELGYELNNRPTWVRIPLQGILQTLTDQTQGTRA